MHSRRALQRTVSARRFGVDRPGKTTQMPNCQRALPWWRRIFRPAAKASVRDVYEKKWTPEAALARFTRRPDNHGAIVWGDRRYFAYGIWIKRVHLLFLMRLIEKLQPTNVLEVGSGMGLNLCILAARFPDIKFTGIELTAAGDEVARAFRAMPTLPEQFSQFSPLPLVDEKRTKESNYTKAVRHSFHSKRAASIWSTASRLLSRWN